MPDGEIRAREDIYSAFLIELMGGMQEPAHAAATTLLGLCGESAQYQDIVDDPSLITQAVAEGLRWIAPVGGAFRQTTREVVIHGRIIPKDSIVFCMIGSGNRDQTKFNDADRYDLHRRGPSNLSFGGGVHFCAGNVFGRELARIALEELVKVAPTLRLADEDFKMRGWLFRAPQTLYMSLGKD